MIALMILIQGWSSVLIICELFLADSPEPKRLPAGCNNIMVASCIDPDISGIIIPFCVYDRPHTLHSLSFDSFDCKWSRHTIV